MYRRSLKTEKDALSASVMYAQLLMSWKNQKTFCYPDNGGMTTEVDYGSQRLIATIWWTLLMATIMMARIVYTIHQRRGIEKLFKFKIEMVLFCTLTELIY